MNESSKTYISKRKILTQKNINKLKIKNKKIIFIIINLNYKII